MLFPTLPGHRRLLAAVFAAGFLVPSLAIAGAGSLAPAVAGVGASFSPPIPQVDIGEPARIKVAQSRNEAQLQVQIQELQEQIRLLTGQVEGLQFQLAQTQTLIERMTADNEFRFQALEGGAGGKLPAATEPAATAPAAQLPQIPAPAQDTAAITPEPLDLGNDVPMELPMGDSQDPLIGGAAGQNGSLGALSTDGAAPLDGSRPLDLSLDGGATVSSGDANAQYQAGYDAIVRGDYAFAEDQFQQFIALYPEDAQAPDATNWLGEALIQRGAFDDAALILAEGYQKYQATERAPDLMLKLGIALNGAGEPEVACRTYFTLEKRFTGLAPAFVQRLGEEKSKAQCPV